MKLNYDKKSKDPTYFGQVGVRNGNKTTTKNVIRIGKHSELLKITDNPLEYAKKFIEEYNKNSKATGEELLNVKINFNEKLSYTDKTISNSTALNVGYLVLQQIYNALNLKEYFQLIEKNYKVKFDCNAINRFLTYDRILNPRSKLGTSAHLQSYYEKPDIQYHQILRFMDVLYENTDSYIEHLFDNSSNIVSRDTSICYYDCTNYYFETECDDEENHYVDPYTGELMDSLRYYGHSKENRPNPIVQMGLFMDAKGIPLSMCIHPGNTNEQITVLPLERKLLKMFKNKKFIYCADGGLNSYSIRLYNSFSDRAFIVTQSVKKLSTELQEAVINDCDYKMLSDNSKVSLKMVQTFDNTNVELSKKYYDKVIYKILTADKSVDLGLQEEKTFKNGKTVMVNSKGQLKQKIIVTYSRKIAEYQKYIRERQVARAQKIINTMNVEDVKAGPNDVKRFIKRTSNGKNGEKAIDHYSLDTEKIKKEAIYDGFYAVATNLEDDSENELAKKVLETNAGRYKIEDCFRVLKTNFDARPVYHRNPNRIRAHFLICYTALLVYRLLEAKLDDSGNHYTTNEILETLKNMNVVNMQDLFYSAAYTSSSVCTSFNELFDLGLDKKYYRATDLNKIKRKKYNSKRKSDDAIPAVK